MTWFYWKHKKGGYYSVIFRGNYWKNWKKRAICQNIPTLMTYFLKITKTTGDIISCFQLFLQPKRVRNEYFSYLLSKQTYSHDRFLRVSKKWENARYYIVIMGKSCKNSQNSMILSKYSYSHVVVFKENKKREIGWFWGKF